MQDPSTKERLSYEFDNLMGKPGASLALLLSVTGAFTLFGGIIYYFGHTSGELDFFESVFRAWTFVADPGTHAGEEGFGSRVASLIITSGGFVSFAILIGLIGESITMKVEDLRKGKNRVLEKNHTLVLGWNDKIFSFLDNLAIANESENGGTAVILADDISKEQMEEEIRENCNLRGTKVVCRSGNMFSVSDLKKVSAEGAKCVVVFADEKNRSTSDARALRTVLALIRGVRNLSGHIVVEIVSKECSDLIEMVGDGNVVPLVAHDMIGRLLIQCARQPGLAEIYITLLSFDDAEFYLSKWPKNLGPTTFAKTLFYYDGAVVVGINKKDGRMLLNPSQDSPVEPGDRILVLAEDDSTFSLRKKPIDVSRYQAKIKGKKFVKPKTDHHPINILFCGWRTNMEEMIHQLDEFLPPGSTLTIMSPLAASAAKKRADKIMELEKYKNITITIDYHDPQSRHNLKKLFRKQKKHFKTVVIFSDASATVSTDESTRSDSLVLVTTLFIQDILKKNPDIPRLDIVSEISDPNTKTLVAEEDKSDWVVSNELVAMVLTQMAECKENRQVWEELFVPEGHEIYLKNLFLYLLQEDEEVCFWDLYVRGRARREIVIGWVEPGQKPTLNPEDKQKKHKFSASTRIAIIAEDDYD